MRPIHLALVWHMHQPYYKDDLTSTYLLPWVRLRSAKDYHKMPALLDDHPGIRQTVNLVPSLLSQIEDYVEGDYQDLFLNLTLRPAADLDPEERSFILRWMRESPAFLRVQASPRYLELAARPLEAEFSVDDMRDLQVWSNLAWCDPAWMEKDAGLSALKAKDSGFTEADKRTVVEAQLEAVARVIPRFREVADRGQAELTFSPQHHPILPLISDVGSAREALPGLALPERRFVHPEDARRQVEMGMETFQRLLGRRPQGMWPPEMAVGDEVAALAGAAGVSWFIGDEETLARSAGFEVFREAGVPLQPELLYTPCEVDGQGGPVTVVFRDALLSNLIGFDYQRMPALDAAQDFVGRLGRIRERQGDEDWLVVVALDGENPWEFYPRDGHDFLDALYRALEEDPGIATTTVAGFLAGHTERHRLDHLHTGSWIGASLDTWIGDPEHNAAWDLLAETRDWLEGRTRRQGGDSPELERAWREVFVTEGSDWFWWFSRRHDSGMDAIWDNQFRLHLRNVYKLAGAKPPARLFQPIIERGPVPEQRRPERPISPRGPDDPAWQDAGYHVVGSGFGALHKPLGLVQRLLYGGDDDYLHVRVDSRASAADLAAQGVAFWLYLSGHPAPREAHEQSERLPIGPGALADLGFDPARAVRVEPRGEGAEMTVFRVRGAERVGEPLLRTLVASPFTFSVPFRVLGRRGGEPVELSLVVTCEGSDVEQIPPAGSLGLSVPRPHRLAEAGGGGPVRVLIAASEASPLAKSGGMADVTAALSAQLRAGGHDVRLVMPRHRGVRADGFETVVPRLAVRLGGTIVESAVLEGRLGAVPVYLIDCPALFDRDSLYGFEDDDARFVYLSRAALEMLRPVGFIPDVVHCHDWHTALIPNLLERLHAHDPVLSEVATALTIHNLAHQGRFGSGALHLAGLEPWGLLDLGAGRADAVNFLARGIHFADAVNTVSERYAEEIQSPEMGEGLDALVRLNAHKLYGILNGIDYRLFDPERDPALAHPYSASDLEGKALDKAALRSELGLEESSAPLIAIISRLYGAKGLDLVEMAMPALLALDAQWAVLGAGDRVYEEMLRQRAAQSPHRVFVHVGFDQRRAQAMYAGADMLLMPSRIEPCGLGQLIALRYGTIPIVRATGGLADTIEDVDPAAGSGFGFTFRDYDPWQLHAAVVRAVETYRHRAFWRELVERAMARDVSWERSARRYVQLYRLAVASHRDRRGSVALGAGRTG